MVLHRSRRWYSIAHTNSSPQFENTVLGPQYDLGPVNPKKPRPDRPSDTDPKRADVWNNIHTRPATETLRDLYAVQGAPVGVGAVYSPKGGFTSYPIDEFLKDLNPRFQNKWQAESTNTFGHPVPRSSFGSGTISMKEAKMNLFTGLLIHVGRFVETTTFQRCHRRGVNKLGPVVACCQVYSSITVFSMT